MHVKRPRRGIVPGTPGEEEALDQLKPHKPAGGEPVHDEEMFVDPLTVQINSGDNAEDPPAGT